MAFECPVCSSTEELLPVANARKGYQQCCRRCESLVTLFTRNYPYGQPWFKNPVPVLPLITGDAAFQLPVKDSTLPKDEALVVLKELREWLGHCVDERLRGLKAADIVVSLARLFVDLTAAGTDTGFLEGILSAGQSKATVGRLATKLFDLRISVILLQNLSVKYAASSIHLPDHATEVVIALLAIIEKMRTLATVEDAIYYKIYEATGVKFLDGRPIAIDDRGLPAEEQNAALFEQTFEELMDSTRDPYQETIDEFYRIPPLLDDVALETLHFTVTDLLNAYFGLAKFADWRGNGLIV
jgi:hypothetical protein